MTEQGNQKVLKRGDVVWVELDPAIGTEIKKTRPAIIISNDAQNKAGKRLIIAPLTSNTKKVYPFETIVRIEGNLAKAMFDQIRTVDISRLGNKLGNISIEEIKEIDKTLKLVLSLS